MSDRDVLDRTTDHELDPYLDHELDRDALDERTAAFVDFLEGEFPDWDFAIDETSTWGGEARPLWIATRAGHHPQSALTAGKLHRRLSDYEDRESARHAGSN